MLNAGWPALLAALSFLTTNLSDPLFGDVLGALQVLARAAGFLALPTPRPCHPWYVHVSRSHFIWLIIWLILPQVHEAAATPSSRALVGVAPLGLTPHNQHNLARKYGPSLRQHLPPHQPPPPSRGSDTDTPSRPQMRRGGLRECPAALPPPMAPRARKYVGGVSDNAQSPRHLHHATPDIPHARKRVRVYTTMPRPPPHPRRPLVLTNA
jgi:hypothetical protein